MSQSVPAADPLLTAETSVGANLSTPQSQHHSRDAQLALALDAGAMGAWTWDIATNVVTWSAAIEPMHGLPSGTFIGTLDAFLALVHPDERAHVGTVIETALRDGSLYEVSYHIVRPDGETRVISGRGRVLRDAAGHATGIAGIVQDVTDTRAATEALRASEARYRALTEVAPQIIWAADTHGAITFVNQSWIAFTGLALEESLGDRWLTVVQPEHRARVTAVWQTAVRTGNDYDIEIPFRDSITGIYRWHLVRGRRLSDEAGTPTSWVGTALDIHDRRTLATEREQLLVSERNARQTAEDAVRMRDAFLSVAAHELNTPLTTLRGNIQLLQRRYTRGQLDPERLNRSFATLDAATGRLTGLVHELLDVSRLHTGRLTLEPHSLDLVAFVIATLTEDAVLLDERHTLTTALPDEPLIVTADAVRLAQVLTNLLSNAVKYAPDGGEIAVSVARATPHDAAIPPAADHAGIGDAETPGAVVRVRDNGIGLPPGSAETIFTPFSRAANAVRGHVTGLGLGLYISRSIVVAHGGQMWAESPGEAQGTIMTFWLPVVTG